MNPDKMKVLIVGQNYASVMNSLAYGLKQNGVAVKAVSFEFLRSDYNNYDQFQYVTAVRSNRKFLRFVVLLYHMLLLSRWLLWADVVHVYVYPTGPYMLRFQLKVINLLARKKFITFLGSEVRRPDITKQHAQYFSAAYADDQYEYRHESEERSYAVQQEYKGFSAIVWDVGGYLFEGLFRSVYIVPHASRCNMAVKYPSAGQTKIRIIHAPSAPVAKGSKQIIPLMEKLAAKHDFIDFQVIRSVSNERYQQILGDSDILIDQVVWGAFGVASQQAMELGKIVFAHISDQNQVLYGPDCPVVNITLENLEKKILELHADPALKLALAKASRAYYEKQFQPEKVAARMKNIYITD